MSVHKLAFIHGGAHAILTGRNGKNKSIFGQSENIVIIL